MNKTTLLGILATGALIATTGLAFAENPQPKGQHGQQQMQAQQAQQGQQPLAQQQLDGRIVAVDKAKGTLSVHTAQHGQLEFKLTQAQIQGLNEGEQIRLQIQLQPMPKQQ